ncbi:MAG TPA: cytochrome c oxidase assembly protein, partial [Candidatus Limnocylindrales bacterium]
MTPDPMIGSPPGTSVLPLPARRLARRVSVALCLVAGGAAVLAPPVAAHGADVPPEPAPADLLFGWSFDPSIQLPLLATLAVWLIAVRRVDRAHPGSPVPRRRTVAFVAGLAAIEIALQSGIERYDTTLFTIHMVQHILLIMVAGPLIALSAPITLALRVARPDIRRRWIVPLLHSRIVRAIGHPVVAWLVFAGVLWGTHFSPIFDHSLEDPVVHDLEHVAFVAASLLFW